MLDKNSKKHILKIKPIYFEYVRQGFKTFELRLNDRDYKVGDYVHFVNTDGKEFETQENNLFKITYVLKDIPEYGLNEKFCIFSLMKVKDNE